ncbi:helicase [Pseudothermotoga hypogea DSM 11164 = NBRC 106472]|uniref:ATP-dependent DNA helicase RecG n=1 Tax=Pseudothermotoga hypogea DSM 11164 = NBRC 106472 TaxID=1123384 RepID=A0A0X1KRH3_9THEM|nr:helicase [Pseudothermotoga hypogea DSM 11164 = NBRC 106472]
MLVEEFLKDLEELIMNVLDSRTSLEELSGWIDQSRELLQDPLLDDADAREKLDQLIDYLKPTVELPKERALKRLTNALGMIERYRSWHFFAKPDPSQAKQLSLDIKSARGVGPRREKLLRKLEINSLRDLVFYFPRDYEDRRRVISLKDLLLGEKVTTRGKISSVEMKSVSGMKIVAAVLADGIHHVLLKWFNQEFIYRQLQTLKGKEVYVTGTVKKGMFGGLEIVNPEVELVENSSALEILPVYPLTEGMSQKEFRRIVRQNIDCVAIVQDELPLELTERRKLIDLAIALYGMHFPKTTYQLEKSRERLAYEELLYLQLAMLFSRHTLDSIGGVAKKIEGKLAQEFLKKLPFQLTNAQKRAHEEIRQDLRSTRPMSRLLQGDVGCGKTVVAQLAIIDNFEAGFQAAVMAPTSILATQHYRRMAPSFENLGIKTALLLGETNKGEKERIKRLLRSGELSVVIGTHTLIQEDVEFDNLGLVVIDEQHRFGVRQREALISKGAAVDTLVMTATPIPRTLALAVYGDLDLTIIDEMPPGRKDVKTILVSVTKIDQVFDFVRKEVEDGNQAFIVYPLIEESDKLQVKAATQMYEKLSNEVFKDLRVGLLHGRMSQQEKDAVMEKFARGDFDILVSTTVIEVGIDVPNATVMVIENPERFGLAQLHQLRGRIGRSDRQGYCFLVVGNVEEEALERLKYFASTKNGFEVAEYDMKLRGPGEILGLRQHGLPDLKVADLIRDKQLLFRAREDAEFVMKNLDRFKALIEKIEKIYGERLKLVKVG